MTRGVVLLHGLPGVGKTTTARRLAETTPQLFYVDLAEHPDFGSRPMAEICTEEYLAHGAGRSLLTEGVLPQQPTRDGLVSHLIEATAGTEQPLQFGLIVFIDEPDLETMAKRRDRSVEEYAALRSEMAIGSRQFEYVHHVSDEAERGDVEVRVERLRRLVLARMSEWAS